jgi:hypothetical protein
MTGNRAPTEQAVTRAHDFATAHAETGHTVTATLALGVEPISHQAAAKTDRVSLALLPRGLDGAHPNAPAPLLRSILDSGGAAISIYRPGTAASDATLKASAVVLAALARALILIKALDHVVAMYAANTAVDLHRPMLAAPTTGDARSSGNVRLPDWQLAVNRAGPRLSLALPHARVARAGDVAGGDLLVAAVGSREPTTSAPLHRPTQALRPPCRCGMCCLVTESGEVVVLSQESLGVLRSVTLRRPPSRRLCPAADPTGPSRSESPMSPTTYTPSLPGLTADDNPDTVINWGAGADATAYITKVLTAPDAHGIHLDRTAVLYMATGSEWPETRLLADEFIRLLREHGVRCDRRCCRRARAGSARSPPSRPPWLPPRRSWRRCASVHPSRPPFTSACPTSARLPAGSPTKEGEQPGDRSYGHGACRARGGSLVPFAVVGQ